MAPASDPRSISRRALLRGAVAAGVGGVAGAGIHGYLYERHHIDVTHLPLVVSGLPDALRGVRVGLLTDPHRSQSVPHALIEHGVRLLMDQRPDLIVLGGDYVTQGNRRYVGPAADALGGLSAPHGVFAILGNHDDDRDMPAALAAKGFAVLKDARTRVTLRGESIDIIGIRYWTRRLDEIARLARGATAAAILAAHNPARLTEAAALGLSTMLSGHTHGGQVVLPGIGAINQRRFPIISGLGRRANTTAFVSRGLGTVYLPVRVNCPPEVAVLTLMPAESL